MKNKQIFKTNKRIRLGIWGLGRGMSFFSTCKMLNVDVVAGCDYNEHMRNNFLAANPGAFATSDAEEFLKQDFDAVLLATFCPSHGPDAIRCLRAGKHVLSEVTSFFTMAEGVALVDEVEKSGKVYNLAENYPFSESNSYLARKYKEGLFGELLYAEYEYVHECRSLQYTYIDGLPVQPGHSVHNWRSWLSGHYYCTHSLGPLMVITGLRPVQVVALPNTPAIPGTLCPPSESKMANVNRASASSLIRMSNGAVVRNLMGTTTNDSHAQRLWGTLGSAESGYGNKVQLRLGGSGGSPKHEVTAYWDELGQLAAESGHGGGDFWVVYYFARQILTGEKAPWDIYSACDVTIPGILATRSAIEGGKAFDVPDFRDKAQRNAWRDDHWVIPRYDVKNGAFGPNADPAITKDFSKSISALCRWAPLVRSFADWTKVKADMAVPEVLRGIAHNVLAHEKEILESYKAARKIADVYPKTDGGRVLREMLELGLEKEILTKGYFAKIKRSNPPADSEMFDAIASEVVRNGKDIEAAPKPARGMAFDNKPELDIPRRFWYIHKISNKRKDGLIYIRGKIKMPAAGQGLLHYGADGPVKVWVNGQEADNQPDATNPIVFDEYKTRVNWKKGDNEVLFALTTNNAWGVCARGSIKKNGKKS